MNQKEVGELRRRLRPGKNNFSHVYGCYVSPLKEIIAEVDQPLSLLNEDDVESCLALLRKALSGGLGRNLVDVAFSTRQVAESEELKRLLALRDAKLKDAAARREFYETVIQSLELGEDSYLILLAQESYDVPFRTRNDEVLDDSSDTVYSYLLCAVCPMREGKPGLGYVPNENAFHVKTAGRLASPPEVGFLWPAFDDRAANIYSALAYSKKADQLHQEFLDAIFHIEDPPMSAGEQRQAFENALVQSMEGGCSLEVVQAVHERLALRIEEHKESKDPEPLAVTAREVGTILRDCGVEEPQVEAFCQSCGRQFGEGAALSPANLIDSKRFQVRTGDATLTLAPDRSYLLETRVIEGRKYLLVPVDGEMEVNGLAVE